MGVVFTTRFDMSGKVMYSRKHTQHETPFHFQTNLIRPLLIHIYWCPTSISDLGHASASHVVYARRKDICRVDAPICMIGDKLPSTAPEPAPDPQPVAQAASPSSAPRRNPPKAKAGRILILQHLGYCGKQF